MAKPAAMLLALDTCFNGCSVALFDEVRGAVVASRLAVMERGHAEALGPMVEAVFEAAGLAPSVLTRVAVTYGPGTFTGLRIGLAYAKGLALALDIPLVGIDSLTAMAAPHFGGEGNLVVLQQAGGTGHFYWAAFDLAASRTLKAPAIGSLDAVIGFVGNGVWTALGSGTAAMRERCTALAVIADAEPDAARFAAYASTLAGSDVV